MFVKEHANTTLKGPLVGKNIPTVAEVTQGEVVKVTRVFLSLFRRGRSQLTSALSVSLPAMRVSRWGMTG